MKKSRFTDSQIIDALKRAEAGLTVLELWRELGISSATFYKWRAKFGGMDTSIMARLGRAAWSALAQGGQARYLAGGALRHQPHRFCA